MRKDSLVLVLVTPCLHELDSGAEGKYVLCATLRHYVVLYAAVRITGNALAELLYRHRRSQRLGLFRLYIQKHLV